MFDTAALTPERLKGAAKNVTFGQLGSREFRFYQGDFISAVISAPLTVSIFPSRGAADPAHLWTAACFCHFENTNESSQFIDSLAGGVTLREASISEFRNAAAQWIDKINPELSSPIDQLQAIVATVQNACTLSNAHGVTAIVGIGAEEIVLFLWTEVVA